MIHDNCGSCQALIQLSWPKSVKCTGEVREHDPHSACWLVKEVMDLVEQLDNDVFYSHTGLVDELKGILMWFDYGP